MIRRSGAAFVLAAILGAAPARALDVPDFLRHAAVVPEAEALAVGAERQILSAEALGQPDPWQLSMRQEGIGPTGPDNQVFSTTLSVPFDLWGVKGATVAAARAEAEAQTLLSRQVRLDQQIDDLHHAWQVLAAREQLTVIDRATGRIAAWHRRLALRVKAGRLPALILDRFSVLRSELAVTRLGIVARAQEAGASLEVQGLLPHVTGGLPPLAEVPADVVARPLPELTALEAERRALDRQEDALQRSRWPQPSAEAEWERFDAFGSGQNTLGLALGLSLPNHARLHAEAEAIRKARAQVEARTRAVLRRRQIERNRARSQQQAAQAEYLEINDRLIPGLEQQTGRVLALVERGLSDPLPLLELHRSELQAELRRIDVHAAYVEGGYVLWLLAGAGPSL